MSETKEFILTNGTKYMRQNIKGKYEQVSNITMADVYPSKKQALKILENSIPKWMSRVFYIAEIRDGQIYQKELSEEQILERRKNVSITADSSYNLPKYSFDDDVRIQNMIRGFEDVKTVLDTYANKAFENDIRECVTRANLILEDVKHYHARKALNARDGFRLNKLEDAIIIQRISVKNQATVVGVLVKYAESMREMVDDICRTIECLRSRSYTPRVLQGLFESNDLDVDIAECIYGKSVSSKE